MKITNIRIDEYTGTFVPPEGYEPPQASSVNGLKLYDEFRKPKARPQSDEISAIYVSIETDSEHVGIYGPIEEPVGQSLVIYRQVAPFLRGCDPLATELLHDLMLRMDRHGRSGQFVTVISALDNALWDLKGRYYGEPIYRLLGGPVSETVRAYSSNLGFAVEPDAAEIKARAVVDMGFDAQKWFFPYGPGSGIEGIERNVELARAVRAGAGVYGRIMFDAHMGWDVPYAVEMCRHIEDLSPYWLEEPFPPERPGAFLSLKEKTSIPLATGEHVYTRWQTKELLRTGAVDFLQNDPDWTGGITEQLKICDIASAFDVPVIAHGHSLLPALHVAAARPDTVVPYVEYLHIHQERIQYFQTPVYRPVRGSLSLPEKPGMGFDIDTDKVGSRREITYD